MRTRLLIAGGDYEELHQFQAYFEDRGYEVAAAGDGLKCLGLLTEFRPDVLVLDHDLQWGGGEGVLTRLREETWERLPPVVLLSDPDEADATRNELQYPVAVYLVKPIRSATLWSAVRVAMENGPLQVDASHPSDRFAHL